MEKGPVQILVIGFQDPKFDGSILAQLDVLRDHDVVRLIDLVLVRRNEAGELERILRSDLSSDEAKEYGAYAGALVGLGWNGPDGVETGAALGTQMMEDGHIFDDTGTWYVDDAIPANGAAAIALLEHRWAIGLRDAIHEANGFHLADAWIHPADLVSIGLIAAGEVPV